MDDEVVHSYLYKFNIDSSQLDLYQEMMTFNPVGGTVVQIKDSKNALNHQWFIIFADGTGTNSLVYKLSPDGVFVLHQSLIHASSVLSVESFTRIVLPLKYYFDQLSCKPMLGLDFFCSWNVTSILIFPRFGGLVFWN